MKGCMSAARADVKVAAPGTSMLRDRCSNCSPCGCIVALAVMGRVQLAPAVQSLPVVQMHGQKSSVQPILSLTAQV